MWCGAGKLATPILIPLLLLVYLLLLAACYTVHVISIDKKGEPPCCEHADDVQKLLAVYVLFLLDCDDDDEGMNLECNLNNIMFSLRVSKLRTHKSNGSIICLRVIIPIQFEVVGINRLQCV